MYKRQVECVQKISAFRAGDVDQIRDDVHQLCFANALGLPDEEAVASATGIAVRVQVTLVSSAEVYEGDIWPWLEQVGRTVELGLVLSGLRLFRIEVSPLIAA